MKRFLTLFCGVAFFATASTTQAQIEWAAGAPGGTPGGSIEILGGDAGGDPILDTGIAAAAVGGNRDDADLDGLPDSTDYTISAWINSTVDDGAGNAETDHWWFGTGAQGIHLGILNAPEVDFIPGPVSALRHGHWASDNSGTTSLPSNAWVHATYVFDADGGTVDALTGIATGSVTIYRDGVSEGTFDTLAPNNSTTNLIIGARNGGEAGWVGFIDDVAVFDTALTAANVSSLAGSGDPVALGAVAYYDFEDSQAGTTAASSVAGGLGQTLTGIGDALPPLPPVATWTTGAPNGTAGGALIFDGANTSFLDTGIPAADVGGSRGDADADGLPDSTDYTISAWINSAEEDGAAPGNAANDRWWFGTGSQGIHFGVFDGSKIRQGHWGADNSGTSVVPVSTWTHAAYVFDADGGSAGTGEIKIYGNGVLESTFDSIAPNRATTNLIIGSRSGGRQSWNGSIDDVAVFNTTLTDTQVATLADSSADPISLGAVAYYDFEDDQTGSTAANAGSFGFAQLDRIAPAGGGGPVMKGDVDLDGGVTFLDIQPFITVLSSNGFQAEADCDCDGDVDFLDIQPFINILAGLAP